MKKENKFIEWLKRPRGWLIAVVYVLTIIFIVGALLILTVEYEGTYLEIIAYCLFSLAAISLGYSVYVTIRFAGKIKQSIINLIEKYEFTSRLMRDFGFRTVIFTIGSLAFSFLYGVFNGVLGVMALSGWYGSLSAYYIILVLMRGGIILHHGKKRRASALTETDLQRQEIKIYRANGILLIILSLALIAPVLQMVFTDNAFSYAGLMIFASAAYAFYKITMSIINLVRATKQDDLTVQAIRNVNLADAMVSILALQTALLYAYSGENVDIIPYFNAATGGAVCLLTLALGIYMIIHANKHLREIKIGERKTNGREER